MEAIYMKVFCFYFLMIYIFLECDILGDSSLHLWHQDTLDIQAYLHIHWHNDSPTGTEGLSDTSQMLAKLHISITQELVQLPKWGGFWVWHGRDVGRMRKDWHITYWNPSSNRGKCYTANTDGSKSTANNREGENTRTSHFLPHLHATHFPTVDHGIQTTFGSQSYQH